MVIGHVVLFLSPWEVAVLSSYHVDRGYVHNALLHLLVADPLYIPLELKDFLSLP